MGCMLCGNVEPSRLARLTEGLRALDQMRYRDSYDILHPLAASGDPIAQCRLGSMLQLGIGVDTNGDEAARYYRLAGAAGCALAWNNLATLCALGTETQPPDKDEARKCYEKALALGFDCATGNPYR
jgi:TPR repeat protein